MLGQDKIHLDSITERIARSITLSPIHKNNGQFQNKYVQARTHNSFQIQEPENTNYNEINVYDHRVHALLNDMNQGMFVNSHKGNVHILIVQFLTKTLLFSYLQMNLDNNVKKPQRLQLYYEVFSLVYRKTAGGRRRRP